MRYWFVLLLSLAVLLAGCVPQKKTAPSLHDLAIYGLNGKNMLYGYFYGSPATVTVGGKKIHLSEGKPPTDDPLAVSGTLLVNGKPYLQQALPPLSGQLFSVAHIPLTSDLQVRTKVALTALLYYDGNLWFTLLKNAPAGLDKRVVPQQRVNGLHGVGQLTDAEAAMLEQLLESQGPLAFAVTAKPLTPARKVDGLKEYLRTAIVVQQKPPTNPAAYQPPAKTLNWQLLAKGNQAVVQGPQYDLITSQTDLVNLWNQAYGNQLNLPPVPQVDFGRQSVVAIFLGSKPTGGYGVDVQKVSVQNDQAYLDAKITSPAPGAITTQSLTSPWALVQLNATGLTAVWIRDADSGALIGVARGISR
jgi:hypothetical protein